MRVLSAAIALLLVAFGQVVRAQTSLAQESQRLDPRILTADRAKYKDIRDAKDWLNPKVLVGADGIEVVSSGLSGGRKTVTADTLRGVLIDLPVEAWPYGRVVLASDPGPRSGTQSEDERRRRHHDAVQRILKGLDVLGDWWPPA
jgi:hypothetical protein